MIQKRYISIRFFCILLSVSFGMGLQLFAQNSGGGFAGSFSRMGFSPRGMAMGNAMSAVIHEGSYSYYNPALAALNQNHIQVDAGTAALQFDRSLNMMQSHFQLPPSAGLSVRILHSRISNIDGRDINGFHTGFLSTNEFQFAGNFGIRFSEKAWGGVGIKYNMAKFHPDLPLTSGLGLDFGLLLNPFPKFRIGFSVLDLLASYRFNTSELFGTDSANNQQFFPIRILGGISYELTQIWIISADFESRFHSFESLRIENESTSRSRIDDSFNSHFFRMGSNVQLHERFTLRGGLQFNDLGQQNDFQPGGGFSIHLPYDSLSPSIDYAFVREPSGFSNMHVFAIRLNL